MNLRKKITIVIPTQNRYDRLLRQLEYHNSYDFPANLILLDSSINKKKPDKLKKILENKSIKYIEYPEDIDLFSKVKNGFENIKTPYSLLCADDDFISFTGIKKSVEFLKTHDEYVTVHGNYILFSHTKNSSNTIIWRTIYNSKSFEQVLPSDRMFDYLAHYSTPILYAVHRTKIIQLVWNATEKYTTDVRFGELLSAILPVIYGKIKVLDIFYSARENNQSSIGHISKQMTDFIQDGSYHEKYNNFRYCLTNVLVSEENISQKKSQQIIDKAMNKYLGSSLLWLKFKGYLKRNFKKTYLVMKLYYTYNHYTNIKKKKLYINNSPPIEYNNPESPYYNDFVSIKGFINKKFN